MTRILLRMGLVLFLISQAAAGTPAQADQRVRFQTGGFGLFSPANLGVGDPTMVPTIIGDGSGYAAYNGTPRGNEFRLNGRLVGDGWDQHFGAAQSFTPGVVAGDGVVLYPYFTANNPIRPGQAIHIMRTRVGEVWFQYTGFFTLDTNAGTLVSRSIFEVVGGTQMFNRASGRVFVITRTNLRDITPAGAPFRYDFDGIVNLR